MSNVNNIEIASTQNVNHEQVVQLPPLPKVAASNISTCYSLLKKFPFNRGVFEDLSCYIVNSEYLAWTIKLRLSVDGEVVEDGNSGFVPPTQLVYADVLRNYMEKIVPLNFAVGDITIELRFVANQEIRLWCVDFVMAPIVRNDLPMPPALPHLQCKPSKPTNASNFKPSFQAPKSYTASANKNNYPWPLLPMYGPMLIRSNVNQMAERTIAVPVSRKKKKKH